MIKKFIFLVGSAIFFIERVRRVRAACLPANPVTHPVPIPRRASRPQAAHPVSHTFRSCFPHQFVSLFIFSLIFYFIIDLIDFLRISIFD
jgi:hypothetical protein